MPNTHPINRKRYWHLLKYTVAKPPRREISWTTEFGGKCRNGVGRVYRILWTRWAIVFGRWVPKEAQASVILENELAKCHGIMERTEKELRRIIGPDTQIRKFGNGT